jgi:OOP family OmpA-OmpF porin
MKIANASAALGLAALAGVASPTALAQHQVPVWYGGINIGQAREHFDHAMMARSVLPPAFAVTGTSDDRRDTGYKLYAGYRFHRYFAVEGGYFNLGKFDFTATTLPAGTLSGNIKVDGLNLDLVGILPITDRFSAFGRIGLTNARTRDSFSGTGAAAPFSTSRSERDTNYKFGAGLQFDFNYNLGMRLEAERYRINDGVGSRGNIDLFSIGLVYRFGRPIVAAAPRPAVYTPPPPPPPPAPKAAPPPPPRVEPAPAPVPQPEPLPPRRTRN